MYFCFNFIVNVIFMCYCCQVFSCIQYAQNRLRYAPYFGKTKNLMCTTLLIRNIILITLTFTLELLLYFHFLWLKMGIGIIFEILSVATKLSTH
jgi:hypothetical protein